MNRDDERYDDDDCDEDTGEVAPPPATNPPNRPAAIVIGAGVAGMTAAHELAERGFVVHVIERDVDPENPDLPDPGGAARTQWGHPPDHRPERQTLAGVAQEASDANAAVSLSEADASEPWLPRDQRFILCEGPRFGSPRGVSQISSTLFEVESVVHALLRLKEYWVFLNSSENNENGETRRAFVVTLEIWDRGPEMATRWFKAITHEDPATSESALTSAFQAAIDGSTDRQTYQNLADLLLTIVNRAGDKRKKRVRGRKQLTRWSYDSVELDGLPPDRPRLVLRVRAAARELNPVGPVTVPVPVGQRTALPGEHGYRFFPSFYSNVFDTMRRIPILRSASREAGLPDDDVFDVYRSVYDNLRSVRNHAISLGPDKPAVKLSRDPVRTIRDAFALWRAFQRDLGFSVRDIVLYQVALLKFLTSGEKRRREYENLTWNDYVCAERFSPAFRESLKSWSLALGGLRGDEADARTFGAVVVQFILDQLDQRELVDATLNGPTSVAWFSPWRRFLGRRNALPGAVIFHRDEVLRLELEHGEVRVVARSLAYEEKDESRVVSKPPEARSVIATQRDASEQDKPATDARAVGERPRDAGKRRELPPNAYVVLATQPHEAHRLALALQSSEPDHAIPPDHRRLRRMLDSNDGRPFEPLWLLKPMPEGPLRHFTGVQFFLDEAVSVVEGHLYLQNSGWGLTAIGQSQFRTAREGSRRGVISVDVGATNVKSSADPDAPTFWESTQHHAVASIWNEIQAVATANQRAGGPFPTFTTDRGVTWLTDGQIQELASGWLIRPWNVNEPWLFDQPPNDPSKPWLPGSPLEDAKPFFDNNPYMITTAGRFDDRPGTIDRKHRKRGYDLIYGNLVVAGAYTRTFTRLVTMESACESARHAVNGILAHRRSQNHDDGEPCKVFDPEDLEPKDMQYWRTLDDRLHAEGLPHVIDILKIEAWLDELLPIDEPEEDPDCEQDEDTVVDRFDRLVGVFEPSGAGIQELMRWAGPKAFGLLGLALRVLGR